MKNVLPEVYCDLNARMMEHCYSLQRSGSIDDLNRLHLCLDEAIGKRFAFYMDDADGGGASDDIMFIGVISHHDEYGYLAINEGGVFFHRSDLE